MSKPAKWILHIRPEPDRGEDDSNRRLRAALKYLLRVFSLRCVTIETPEKPADEPWEEEQP